MITPIVYNKKSLLLGKSKSEYNKSVLRSFNLRYPYKSKEAQVMLPMVALTCKKTPYFYPSIYDMNWEDSRIEEKIISDLHRLIPEVPVIECTKMPYNAFYAKDWDKIISQLADYYNVDEDEIIKVYCKEYGIKFNDLKSNLGPHLVVMDVTDWNAPTLAHEFGHYLNMNGKGEIKGMKAHDKLDKSYDRIAYAHYFNCISNLLSFVGITLQKFKLSVICQILSGCGSLCKIMFAKPIIDAEYYATYSGLKLLSQLNVDENRLELYKKELYGTDLKSYKSGYYYDELKNAGIHGALALGAVGLNTIKNK